MTDPQQPLPVPPPVAPDAYPLPPVAPPPFAAPGQPAPAPQLPRGASAPRYQAPNPNPAYQVPAYLPPVSPPSSAQAPAYHAAPLPAPTYQAPIYQAPIYQAPIYQAPPGAFAGPASGYAAPLAPASRPPLGPALGRVALIFALIATVALTAVAAVLGWQIAQGASAAVDFATLESGDLSFLTPVRDLVLWFEITAWTATGLGIWAMVQGIIAIAKRRGRGAGIAAVIIAAIGPFVFAFVVYFALIIGATTGLVGRTA